MADRWASISQLGERYDERLLGELASDTDERVPITGNSRLETALEDATAFVQSAVHQGQTYTESQMSSIVAGSNRLVIRLVCDIAIKHLHARRAREMPSVVQSNYDDAMDILDDLRQGKRVFDAETNASSQTVATHAQPLATRANNLPISSSALYPAGRRPL